jgi:hypothetical protein
MGDTVSWTSWIPRIAGYALAPLTGGASIPIGEAISQGIGNKQAVDKATGQQQTATNVAQAKEQNALMAEGDVYNQQRSDMQNLFGQGYQTLGGLMGMNIAPIGPAQGMIPSTPTGEPGSGLGKYPLNLPGVNPPSGPPLTPAPTSAQTRLTNAPQLMASGLTLKQLQSLTTGRGKLSDSSYAKARA